MSLVEGRAGHTVGRSRLGSKPPGVPVEATIVLIIAKDELRAVHVLKPAANYMVVDASAFFSFARNDDSHDSLRYPLDP